MATRQKAKTVTAKKAGKRKPAKPAGKKLTQTALRKAARVQKASKATAKPLAKDVTKVAAPRKASDFAENMRRAALKVLDDRQAEDIVTISLGSRNSVADYLIIASGRASRQIAAIADYLREAFEKLGIRQVRVEGLQEANWVLIDGGDVIVHLFRPEVRQYYNLESMWADRIKA